ncbi:NAD(P)/FAD-dependent oxidoreductase [Spirosoma endophyticum]|uniref:Glycine/D-amino acid oxidase n=1 Tax=Spirosoma endophyticum TaxID=662367 RepID=A0A1I2GMN6_9BACT|nr:FAD-binding oxidoreductase [Spirosoma endophyticum]SFF17871.1 Glycine/D-amino acid oxidase [Spirosoma endophyticum]
MITKQPHIVVVGAGIVGASLAYHLQRGMAQVTLLDKATNLADGATANSFGWITVNPESPQTYITLRQQAIADWHRLENELKGQLNVNWSGALTWLDDPAQTERLAGKLIGAGYPVQVIDQPQIQLLEPNLKKVPSRAMLAEDEGAIDPKLALHGLITAARQAGVSCQLGNEVLSLMMTGSRLTGVVTAHGAITADIVVLATGVNADSLCQPLAIHLPLTKSPAILVSFHTSHPFVNRIVSSPSLELRAASPRLTLSAEDYLDDSIDNNPQAIARRCLNNIKGHWHQAGLLVLTNVAVGNRPIPEDGLPIIGRIPSIEGLYVAVMHAGVTLAAVVGRLVARELLSDQEEALLASYRHSRFH